MTDLQLNESENLAQAVGVTLGAASMCWTPRPHGLFESTLASDYVDQLTAWVDANYVKRDAA